MERPGSAAVAKELHSSVIAWGFDALAALFAEDAYWGVGGSSKLAGEYKGRDAVVGLFRAIKELSGGTFRPLRSDSWDVLESPYHAAVHDLWLAERGEKRLRSHEMWVIEVEDRHIKAGFHYLENGAAFDDFWS